MSINELMLEENVLVITPEESLKLIEFERLTKEINPHIEAKGTLNGLMICCKVFPGWDNFTEVLSHIRFVKDNHHLIKKVAVVTDSAFLSVLPSAAGHFFRAEIKLFCYQDKNVALE